MPSAPGHSWLAREMSGTLNAGRPDGIFPTMETPMLSSPSSADAARPAITARSGAGECGLKRSMPMMSASMMSESTRVGTETSDRSRAMETILCRNPPLSKCCPSSLGTWSTTITAPMPALKPVNTGSEIKLAIKPNRRTAASISMAPTSSARVAAAAMYSPAVPFGATSASSVAVRIAMVVVVLILSGRDVPKKA